VGSNPCTELYYRRLITQLGTSVLSIRMVLY